jgi:hypothetical protein
MKHLTFLNNEISMGDGKLANLIHIANQKIEFLNSNLEEYGANEFYKLPSQDPRKEHMNRMIHDLDYLIAQSDIEGSDIKEPYLNVRSRLMEIKEHLSSMEGENNNQSAER